MERITPWYCKGKGPGANFDLISPDNAEYYAACAADILGIEIPEELKRYYDERIRERNEKAAARRTPRGEPPAIICDFGL